MAQMNLTQSNAGNGMPRLMRVTNPSGHRIWVNLGQVEYVRTTAPAEIKLHVAGEMVTLTGAEAQNVRDALNRNYIVDAAGTW